MDDSTRDPENLDDIDLDRMLQLVLDSIPTRVFWKDRNSVYRGCNHIFSEDAGVQSVAEIVGKTDYDLAWTTEQAEAFRTDDADVMQRNIPLVGREEPQDHPDQETYWLETSKIPLRNSLGEVVGVLGTYTDITERKLYQQRIEHLAEHDGLTGLPNRRHLEKCMQFLAEQSNERGWAALLFLDLDQFKSINDTLGYAVGDALLVCLAARIKGCIDERHAVTRLGGDEFGILALDVGDTEIAAAEAANVIARRLVNAITQPFEIDMHCLYVGVSIGVATIDPKARDLDKKFTEADLAMYDAKAAGHNNVHLFERDMAACVQRRHELQNRLRQFSSQHSLYLVYQPQFSADDRLVGCEALLRWADPELGVIPPVEFIELAEQTGLIHMIGDWVAEEAFRQLAEWKARGSLPDTFTLAINISPAQFQRPELVDRLILLAEQYGIEKGGIELEVTESLPLGREAEVLNSFDALKTAGFSLVMDDFGSGYSSLAFLTQMPLDKIKIDRSFVSRISKDARHAKIGQTIIQMAENLGVPVVAEGVETPEELQFLKDTGCRYFQGYHYSPGISPDVFANHYLYRGPSIGVGRSSAS